MQSVPQETGTRQRAQQGQAGLVSVLPQEVCTSACCALRQAHRSDTTAWLQDTALEPQRAQLGASQQGLPTGHPVAGGTGSAHVLKSRM